MYCGIAANGNLLDFPAFFAIIIASFILNCLYNSTA